MQLQFRNFPELFSYAATVFFPESILHKYSVEGYSLIPGACKTGRVEVDPNPAAPARYTPMVNPEVEAGPTVTKTRNEENGRRICITKKMVSELGATVGCDPITRHGEPNQDHHLDGKRSCTREAEENLIRRTEFVNPRPEVAAPDEGRTNAPNGARQGEVGPPQESGFEQRGAKRRGDAIDQRWQNDRRSQAATTQWCADWTCVTGSTNMTHA